MLLEPKGQLPNALGIHQRPRQLGPEPLGLGDRVPEDQAVIQGATGKATFSKCGTYRWTLSRTWDSRPPLLTCMFNPSTADGKQDDPTISLLCHIAAHNGFGGIVVVNGIPLCSPRPAEAVDMVNTWDKRQAWYERDALVSNTATIQTECERAGAVLLAWGALADRCALWFEHVIEEIECALPEGVQIYFLGKTAGGYPKHPMARGKHKVPKDAKLIPWVGDAP
ncbi:MAG TPA: DUF1643 domain-containing protein [Ramlibacter sp.]|nr:DUF1643 domain-containing protein [Ramlibacter sp.]